MQLGSLYGELMLWAVRSYLRSALHHHDVEVRMMEGSMFMEKGYDRIAPASETQTQLESRLPVLSSTVS